MSQSPIFLRPVFQDRIWGGTALRDEFGYDIPTETTGECWAISAHPNGQSVVALGELQGKTLSELWENHRELFGNVAGEKFPLLTKILDAKKDLSVQVHPDDEYAGAYENGELGKTECWYIIDCKEGAGMVYGHNAESREELVSMIEADEWDRLLRRVSIKPGDFYYVPSGTIHALCEGTLVLETQQSSDTTYRVYDYNRKDTEGNTRDLHLRQSVEVTKVPHTDWQGKPARNELGNMAITSYVKEKYFSVAKWEVKGEVSLTQDEPFLLVSVIKGDGIFTQGDLTFPLSKGMHFILPAETGTYQLDGELELIVSHV
ncbi:mannose-6-phosphate isomerase, class I [Metabacillus sp. GX 13764]|uniref:mannose-6-phosphate isomerase, class I n=1 Tax=Metabacillus kandeliae TaxID=2900151 RepID=UPI001E5E041D|nr:mannose-6-phosphate isomerase, class I [Metabacillus kandeliae]MCD7034512.1 mannose-6-phosphate isomerase, class I [Metabacillus kandeliae]